MDVPALSFMGVGAAFALFLTMMKSRFLWWPFHPIGYGLAVSYAMDYFWFTALIGWLCKTLTIRYGGIKMYRQALPFFMGLILGDYVTASILDPHRLGPRHHDVPDVHFLAQQGWTE